MIAEPKEWLKTADVAQELGVKPDKIRAWINSGELVAVDISEFRGQRPRYRIAREELNAFLERRATRKPARQRRSKKTTQRKYYK